MDPASPAEACKSHQMTDKLEVFRSQLLDDIQKLLNKALLQCSLQEVIEKSVHNAVAHILGGSDTDEHFVARPVRAIHTKARCRNGVSFQQSTARSSFHEVPGLTVAQQPMRQSAANNESTMTSIGIEDSKLPSFASGVAPDSQVHISHAITAECSRSKPTDSDSSQIMEQLDFKEPKACIRRSASRWMHKHHSARHYNLQGSMKVLEVPWPSLSELPKSPVRALMMLLEKLRNIRVTKTIEQQRTLQGSDFTSESVTGASQVVALVKSSHFTFLVAVVVIANAAWTGVVTELGLRMHYQKLVTGQSENPFSSWGTLRLTVDVVFLCIFVLELLLRVYVEGILFVLGPEAKWNIFDVALVGSGMLDLMLTASNFSFIRILRLIRMVKMLRVVRMVSLFKSLRKMVISVSGCLLSLLWLTLLLLLIIYVYAIGFMQIYLQELETGKLSNKSLTLKQLEDQYGSVAQSMLTLFMAISGGCDWGTAMKPIKAISPFYALLFLFYVIFVIFGVLNVVTGVFVDKSLEITSVDKEFVILEEIQSRKDDIKELKEFFDTLDHDGDGEINKREMIQSLEDHWLQGSLSTLDIDGHAMVTLFDVLDTDGKGTLSVEEFVQGCMRIRGGAKAVDMFALLVESRSMYNVLAQFMEFAEDRFQNIEQAVTPLCTHLHQHRFSLWTSPK